MHTHAPQCTRGVPPVKVPTQTFKLVQNKPTITKLLNRIVSNINPVPANISTSEWRLNIRVILRLVHQSLILLGRINICGPGFLHWPVFVHVPSEGECVCCVHH